MPDFYAVTVLVEMPTTLGARSAAIAKMQPAIEAFKAALEKQGFAPDISEKITSPKGPRAVKAPQPNGHAETGDAAGVA